MTSGSHYRSPATLLVELGIAEPEDIQADGWITHPDSRRYLLREDSIRIGDHYVLSLLWWKDEQQLLDLEEDCDF